MSIYLFKAARRPTYRSENLYLLAAERGTIVDVQYRLSWVASEYFPEGSIRRGEQVNIILTDRPYDRFVPVRSGEVYEVMRADGALRLRVLLNNWIGLPDDLSVDSFTRIVKQSHPDKAPRHKFLAPKLDRVAFQDYFDEREDDGWCRAVDETMAMSASSLDTPYAGSVFFRVRGVSLEEDDAPVSARTRAIEAGSQGSLVLRFYNPHLSDAKMASHQLEVSALGDLAIDASAKIPAKGELSLPLIVDGSDVGAIIQIGPAPSMHTHVVEQFGGMRRQPTESESESSGARQRDLLDLVESVMRNASFNTDGDRIDFWQLVARMLPGETRILEQYALACADAEPRKALQLLRELPHDELGDQAALVLWQLSLDDGENDSPAARAQALGLLSDSRFPDFVATLETMEPRRLASFLPRLIGLAPADEASRELIDRVASRLESPDALAEVALQIYVNTNNPRWAYEFLWKKKNALHLSDDVVQRRLMELAEAGGTDELDPATEEEEARQIGNMIQRDEFEQAIARLHQRGANKVPGHRRFRDRLFHRAADLLHGKGRTDDAIRVLADHARYACGTGDLARATESVERAFGMWTSSRSDNGKAVDPPDWLVDVRDRVQTAWENTSSLVEWRRADEERQREQLLGRWAKSRILVAGGFRRRETVEEIERLTGATVDWCERYRDEGSYMKGFVQRLENGSYDAVVHMLHFTGHETAEQLKPAAEKSGAVWLSAESAGIAGVVGCLLIAQREDV